MAKISCVLSSAAKLYTRCGVCSTALGGTSPLASSGNRTIRSPVSDSTEKMSPFGIDVKPIIELQQGLVASNGSFRLADIVRSRGRRRQSIEHQVLPQIVVLQNHFIGVGVHRHRAIRRRRIADCAHRRARAVGSRFRSLFLFLFRMGTLPPCAAIKMDGSAFRAENRLSSSGEGALASGLVAADSSTVHKFMFSGRC